MDNFWEILKTRWWGQLICALFFYAIAAYDNWHIAMQESTYGYVSLHWFDAIIYGKFGRWGCVFYWGAFGALFTFMGIWNLIVRIRYGRSAEGQV
jgi:hypothetical protein